MDKFLKYFEDKSFIRWILNPDADLNNYWMDYIKNNPDEKAQLELSRIIVSQLKSKKLSGNSNESITILAEIINTLKKKKKYQITQKIFLFFLKYAAVGLLFFSLGIMYNYIQNTDKLDELSEQLIFASDNNNAQLILGGEKNVSIAKKESTVEYRSDGKIVINDQDTVINKNETKTQELNQLVVPYGKNLSVKLPDGTLAHLNAGSRLIYPSFFKGSKREVFLIGEGFFEVFRNDAMPFIVQTSSINVQVLGTKFNLSAYPTDIIVEAVLVEGKIMLWGKGFSPFKKEYILEKDQLAVYNSASSGVEISNVDIMNYVAWHEGYLNFESSHLSRIIKKLERYYNLRILLADPMLGIHSISGKLQLREDEEAVLNVLAKTADAELIKLNETTYVLK